MVVAYVMHMPMAWHMLNILCWGNCLMSFVVPASSGQQHRVGQRRLCTFWFTWLVQVPWNGSRACYVSCKIDHVSNLTINQHQGPGQGRQPGKSNQ